MFTNVHIRLADHGIHRLPVEHASDIRDARYDAEEEVLREINRDQKLSVRILCIRLGLLKTVVWKILKKDGLHRTILEKCIISRDQITRHDQFSWTCRKLRGNPVFLKIIIWTDDNTKFTRTGISNFRNQHVWAAENPSRKN